MNHWYYQKDNQEVGPHTAAQMIQFAGTGEMELTTQVRREDMQTCIAAEKVKELKAAIIQFKNTIVNDSAAAMGSSPAPVAAPGATHAEPGIHTVLTFTESVAHRVTELAGIDKLEGFSPKELFSEVFKKHKSEEVEEYFTVGVPSTTPNIVDVDTTWPRPWVFFRTFVAALLLYFSFQQMWTLYENPFVLPGLMMTGSFVVPMTVLIFFVEMNARRNVSLYQIMRLGFAGGVLALSFSLFLYQSFDYFPVQWMGMSAAGLVEEPAKLLTLALVVFNTRYRYTLNGLLFGAAVGTGFAAFESAGYAFAYLIEYGDQAMSHTISTRGLLSPCAHIVWTAMCGAALWRVKGDRRFSPAMLFDVGFLRVFLIAVLLHMLWNLPIRLPFHAFHLALGAVAWIIVLAFIQDGLKQLRTEKLAAMEQAGNPGPNTKSA